MGKTILLRLLLEEIIKEIGDLENIHPYPYKGNSFVTDEGWKVKVYFDLPLTSNLDAYNIPTNPLRKEATEIAYDVEGVESQFKKTTYQELIKIIKTISEIVLKFIKSHPEKKAFVFFGASKKGNAFETDAQKNKLYKAVIINQIKKSLGEEWILKNIDLSNNFKGFTIYKK